MTANSERRNARNNHKKLMTETVLKMRDLGGEPYPHLFEIDITIADLLEKYQDMDEDQEGEMVALAGRVMEKMADSNGLTIILKSEGFRMKLITSSTEYNNVVMTGHHVGCKGRPTKTFDGELVVTLETLEVTSHCLHPLPLEFNDRFRRFEMRFLDLIVNDCSRDAFVIKSKVMDFLRHFLDQQHFLECETPIINLTPGGAQAKPFLTHYNDLNMELFLRVTSEINLKQLLSRNYGVYEVGTMFENQENDANNYMEVSTCTVEQSFSRYGGLMENMEALLQEMVVTVKGLTMIKYHLDGLDGEELVVDFGKAFKKLEMIPELEKELKTKLPEAHKLGTPEAKAFLEEVIKAKGIECPPNRTTAQILRVLVDKYLVPRCIAPTFIVNYPEIMTPLAKGYRDAPGVTESFELYAFQKRLAGGQTNLTDELILRERVALLNKDRGDERPVIIDEAYFRALESALPPSSGVTINIDKIVMIFTDSDDIREVIAFPIIGRKEGLPTSFGNPQITNNQSPPDAIQQESEPANTKIVANEKEEAPLSKSEFKRKMKAEKKLKEKQEKEAAVKAKVEDMDENDYYKMRNEQIALLKETGEEVYSDWIEPNMYVEDFIETYEGLENGEQHSDLVNVAGRVMSKKESGSKLIFYDLKGETGMIQVMANASQYLSEAEYLKMVQRIYRGDIIGCTGYPVKTKKGELSILPIEMKVLTPCKIQLPPQHFGFKDKETRYRQRSLDLIMNASTGYNFDVRSEIIQFIRFFLKQLGFIDFETPILNVIPGGGTAKPFLTYFDHLQMPFYLRIAPELYLKKLGVGGFERAFEIGKQFRNERADLTHNPEFTTCELYMANADYNDLIELTETLLEELVSSIRDTSKVTYHPNGKEGEEWVADFTPPFKRMDLMEELEKELGVKLPKPSELNTSEANIFFDELVTSRGIECVPPRTTARLLDKLVRTYLEPKCISPTFIMNYPEIMSPLAKWHRNIPGLTERFQLFVFQKEICNAHTELNDPFVQRERFAQQAKVRAAGDDEAMLIDETFLIALEHSLPPTAGLGLGVDRLAMLFTDSNDIKEVILFPMMKPDGNKKK